MVFVTNGQLLRREGELHSNMASVRHELLLPAVALRARGLSPKVLSLSHSTPEYARAVVSSADGVVFGKMLPTQSEARNERFRSNANSYSDLISHTNCLDKSSFCFSDDHFEAPMFADFYDGVASGSRAWVASSFLLRERLEQVAQCPVFSYAEPVESATGAAKVPQLGARARLARWLARRAGVSIESWRIKLLWFGHATNVPSLLDCIEELRSLSRTVPLALECVTSSGTPLDAMVSSMGSRETSNLFISLTPWSPEAQQRALEECDVVLLPQAVREPKKRLKSNNRLIDTINSGRFAVCHPLPSYQELSDYAWVGESMADGILWLLRHPQQAMARVKAGQDYVSKYHSPDALAEFWLKVLVR